MNDYKSEDEASSTKPTKRCPNCGSLLPLDAQFCTTCGTQLPAATAQSAPSAAPTGTPVYNPPYAARPATFPQAAAAGPRVSSTPPISSLLQTPSGSLTTLGTLGVILGVLFILAIVITLISTLLGQNPDLASFNSVFYSFINALVSLLSIGIYAGAAYLIYSLLKDKVSKSLVSTVGKYGVIVLFVIFTWMLSAAGDNLLYDVAAFRSGFSATTGIQFFGGLVEVGLVGYLIYTLIKKINSL